MEIDMEALTADQQLDALTPDVVARYAEGSIPWSQIRSELGVLDFGLMLVRVGEEGLKLPKADPDRVTAARGWMREALARARRP